MPRGQLGWVRRRWLQQDWQTFSLKGSKVKSFNFEVGWEVKLPVLSKHPSGMPASQEEVYYTIPVPPASVQGLRQELRGRLHC